MSIFHSNVPPKTPQVIRIASANVEYRNHRKDALIERFSQLQADMLLILEWSQQNPPANSLPHMYLAILHETRIRLIYPRELAFEDRIAVILEHTQAKLRLPDSVYSLYSD